MNHKKTYDSWKHAKSRTTNPLDIGFHNYGARGIKMCARWINSYENFLADMGQSPAGLTLERVNNEGDYEPENCVWATTVQQGKNKRNSRFLTFNGRTQIMSDWARELKTRSSTIAMRIDFYGWSVRRALATRIPANRK